MHAGAWLAQKAQATARWRVCVCLHDLAEEVLDDERRGVALRARVGRPVARDPAVLLGELELLEAVRRVVDVLPSDQEDRHRQPLGPHRDLHRAVLREVALDAVRVRILRELVVVELVVLEIPCLPAKQSVRRSITRRMILRINQY